MSQFSFAAGVALINNRSFAPGSYIKSTNRDGQAYWSLLDNDGTASLTYTNRRGETSSATLAQITKLISNGYVTRL